MLLPVVQQSLESDEGNTRNPHVSEGHISSESKQATPAAPGRVHMGQERSWCLQPDLSFRCQAGWPPHSTGTPLHMLISDRRLSHGVRAKWPLHHFPLPFPQLSWWLFTTTKRKHISLSSKANTPQRTQRSQFCPRTVLGKTTRLRFLFVSIYRLEADFLNTSLPVSQILDLQ